MPEGVKENIIKGLYLFKASPKKDATLQVNLFGSGAIMNQVIQAQKILEDQYNVAANIWSVTSYTELRREALAVERINMLNPLEQQEKSFIAQCLKDAKGVFVAASDYMKALSDGIRQWIPGPMISLGTDGFGRSESREALRDFFEVDAKHIVYATLVLLNREKKIKSDVLKKAGKELKIDPKKINPMIS